MLTGKDVYEAARPNIVKHGFEDLEWEDFVPEAQEFYVELAARLNTSHIAPLQGLVREYMEFSKYATPILKAGRLEWEAESEALAQRAQSLLAEKES